MLDAEQFGEACADRHFGDIRIAPSRRMVSPLSIGFCKMLSTISANSSGLPSRLGNGTCLPSESCASCGSDSSSGVRNRPGAIVITRSEEHTSELQSLMRNSYAVFCLKKQKTNKPHTQNKLRYT